MALANIENNGRTPPGLTIEMEAHYESIFLSRRARDARRYQERPQYQAEAEPATVSTIVEIPNEAQAPENEAAATQTEALEELEILANLPSTSRTVRTLLREELDKPKRSRRRYRRKT